MDPKPSAAMNTVRGHPRQWLASVNIAVAVATGLWIPLRIAFLGHAGWSAAVDRLLDPGLLLLMTANQWPRLARRKSADPIAGGRWSFALDLLVALPLFTAALPLLGPVTRYLLLVKLLILRRVHLLHRLLEELDGLHPVVARLIPLGVILPIVVNLLACGWSLLGEGTARPASDRLTDYIRSVYWAITTLTTVGYGDISARTNPQMIYASLTMVAGVGVFGYLLGNVASLLARLDAAREQYLERLDRVDAFMRAHTVPATLRTRVREYHRYLWQSRKGWDLNVIMAELPGTLRTEVALWLNAEIIEKVSMLKGADRGLLEEIVLELRPRVLIPGEEIFRIGAPGDAMYFIQRGEIEIVAADHTVLATLGAGSFFGESSLLMARPRNATARAVGYCDVFLLPREAFERVLGRHPDFRRQVQVIAAGRTGDTHPPLAPRARPPTVPGAGASG